MQFVELNGLIQVRHYAPLPESSEKTGGKTVKGCRSNRMAGGKSASALD